MFSGIACSPAYRNKYLSELLSTQPDKLLGLEIVIARYHWRITSYRIVPVTNECICILHRCGRYSARLTRSLHLL